MATADVAMVAGGMRSDSIRRLFRNLPGRRFPFTVPNPINRLRAC